MSNNDKRQFIFTSADDDVHFFMYVAGSAQENRHERDSISFDSLQGYLWRPMTILWVWRGFENMSNNDRRQFIFTSVDDDVHFFMYVAGSAQENINERDSIYFFF